MPGHIGSLQDQIINSGTGRRTYVLLVVIGLIPITASWLLGTNETAEIPDGSLLRDLCADQNITEFSGYWQTHWMAMPLLLPAAYALLRFVTFHLVGSRNEALPILRHFPNSEDRSVIVGMLEDISSSQVLFFCALLATIVFHVFDMWEAVSLLGVAPANVSSCPSEADWTCFHLLPDTSTNQVSAASNAVFVALAYSTQFILVLFALFAVGLLLAHNIFYLNLIYRRSRVVASRPVSTYLVLDFDDPEKKFGVGNLNSTFNVQIVLLVAAAAFILTSRYGNLETAIVIDSIGELGSLMDVPGKLLAIFTGLVTKVGGLSGLFPDFGQIVQLVVWILAVVIVILPSIVKFLPLSNAEARTRREVYLREFMVPTDGPESCTVDELDELAEKFVKNAFWPQGDARAKLYFSFAFFTLFLLVIPVSSSMSTWHYFVVYIALLLFGAYAAARLLLAAYRVVLGWVQL